MVIWDPAQSSAGYGLMPEVQGLLLTEGYLWHLFGVHLAVSVKKTK